MRRTIATNRRRVFVAQGQLSEGVEGHSEGVDCQIGYSDITGWPGAGERESTLWPASRCWPECPIVVSQFKCARWTFTVMY